MPRPKTQRTPKEPKPMGRPLLTGERLATNLQVRVPPKLAETCKELGGANFLRPLIENAAKHAVALKNLKASRPTQDEADGIKFLDMAVQCGFPSPAADYAENDLSLTDYFVKTGMQRSLSKPEATP